MFMPMPQQQQFPGLLGQQSGLNNPLTHMGMGLLAQNRGPKYSTNIADFRNPGIGAGLLGGLESYNRYQQGQAANQYRQQTIAQEAAKQAEAARIAAARGEFQKILADPKSTQQQIASAAFAAGSTPQGAAGLLGTSDPTGVQQNYKMAQDQGFTGSLLDYQIDLANAKRPSVSQHMYAGAPSNARALTPEELGALPPNVNPQGLMVEGGKLKAIPGQPKPKDVSKFEGALDIVNTLEKLSFGDPNALKPEDRTGVFSGIKSGGILERTGQAIETQRGLITQEDPKLASYQGFVRGTAAQLVKALGDAGNLAEGDITRAVELVGSLGGWMKAPDTEEVARNKLDELKEILQRGIKKANSKKTDALGQPLLDGERPPPPPGFE